MSQGLDERLAAWLTAIPYVRFLGMRAELAGDEMTAILPFSPHLVGNPMIPAIHGGVVGAFMEVTALAQLTLIEPQHRLPKTVDVTVEYLRPARALTLYARADVRRIGRRVANVHVEAWQEARAVPVAILRGHFLLSSAPDPNGVAASD
jgi:uncharacterized protein (TIGR00369 family)